MSWPYAFIASYMSRTERFMALSEIDAFLSSIIWLELPLEQQFVSNP
jgi:hypothetical protein